MTRACYDLGRRYFKMLHKLVDIQYNESSLGLYKLHLQHAFIPRVSLPLLSILIQIVGNSYEAFFSFSLLKPIFPLPKPPLYKPTFSLPNIFRSWFSSL